MLYKILISALLISSAQGTEGTSQTTPIPHGKPPIEKESAGEAMINPSVPLTQNQKGHSALSHSPLGQPETGRGEDGFEKTDRGQIPPHSIHPHPQPHEEGLPVQKSQSLNDSEFKEHMGPDLKKSHSMPVSEGGPTQKRQRAQSKESIQSSGGIGECKELHESVFLLDEVGIKNIDELTKAFIPTCFTGEEIGQFFQKERLETSNGIYIPDTTFFTYVAPRSYHIITGYPGPIAAKIKFAGLVEVKQGQLIAHYTYTSIAQVIKFTIAFHHKSLGFVNIRDDILGEDNPFENPHKPIKDAAWINLLTKKQFFEDTYGHEQQRLNGTTKDMLSYLHQLQNGSIFTVPPKMNKPFMTRLIALGEWLKTHPQLNETQIALVHEWAISNKPIDFKDHKLLSMDLSERVEALDGFKDVLWVEYFYAQEKPVLNPTGDLGKEEYQSLLMLTWPNVLAHFEMDAHQVPDNLLKYPNLADGLLANKLIYVFSRESHMQQFVKHGS